VAVNYLHNLSIINLDKHLQVVDTGLHEQEREQHETIQQRTSGKRKRE
jgi:hypothetical protein